MSASKYVFFPLISALMGRFSRESFSYSVLVHSHNLIQEFCRFPLCLSCSVCIDIHGGAYVRASKINNPHFFCFVIGRNFKKAAQKGKVSKRGNLSLPCPNPYQIFMSWTSCYSSSQTASKNPLMYLAASRRYRQSLLCQPRQPPIRNYLRFTRTKVAK